MKRNILISSLLGAILSALPFSAVSEQTQKSLVLTFDDQDSCELVLKALPSLEFDPQSGDVSAFVESLEPCLGSGSGSAAAIFIPSQSQVTSNSTFEVVWASNSETGCTASNNLGAAEWSGTKGPEGIEDVLAPEVSSDTTMVLEVECDGAEASAEITVLEPAPDPVQITSFEFDDAPAGNITRGEGDILEISWVASNASSCSPTGDLSGWQNANIGVSGSIEVELEASGNAGISCEGVDGPDVKGPFSVAVSSTECAGRSLPSDWNQTIDCRPETANSDCRTLEGIFGNDWPMSSSTRLMASGFSSNAKEYLAVGFNSGNISPSVETQFEFANPQSLSSVVTASKLITISKCPGDFNQEAIESEMGPGCYTKKNPTGTFLWGGTDSFNSIFRCALEPNTQYYLNIVATESPAGTDPSDITPHPNCEGNFVCGHRYNNPSFSD